MTKLLFRMTLLALLLIASESARCDQGNPLAKLEKALELAPSFELGGDSRPLVAAEKFVFTLEPDDPSRSEVERRILHTLKEAKTAPGKEFLCRLLRVVGTDASLPQLEQLLSNPKVAHVARYAIASIDSPEALAALRRGLQATSGAVQVGIINSLADKRCTEVRAELIALLASADADVAEAAAQALGRLGGSESMDALLDRREDASPSLAREIDHALLCCAELAAAKGDLDKAANLYASFFQPHQAEHLRFAGFRGLIATRPDDSAQLLVKAIQDDEANFSKFAIGLVAAGWAKDATETFCELLNVLSSERQVLLLLALGQRGDAEAVKALIGAVGSTSEEIRLAAMEALGHAGDQSAVPVLIQVLANESTSQSSRKVCQASMSLLKGPAVEQQLIELAQAGREAERVVAIDALADRQATEAVAALVKLARDEKPAIRKSAIQALGALGSLSELGPLLEIASKTPSTADLSNAETAMARILLRAEDPEHASGHLIQQHEKVSADATPLLLRLLRRLGAQRGLEVVRRELGSTDPKTQDSAFHVLVQWPNEKAGEDLLGFMDPKNSSKIRKEALDGYLRLATFSSSPAEMYSRVLRLLEKKSEKKHILVAIGLAANTKPELDLVLPFLNDSSLQATAGLAVTRIAHRMRRTNPTTAREVIATVIKVVDHQDVCDRAQEVLNDMDKYEGHILDWVGVGPYMKLGEEGASIYKTVFPPEQDGADTLQWSPVTSGLGQWKIDLESTFGGYDHCAAYLKTRIWSETAQDAQLEMGCDDSVKAWLNEKLVYDQWRLGDANPRQFRVKVSLQHGWNVLMLKVVDHQGGWAFGCRLRKPDGTALDGLRIEALSP
ncbi:MAG: HEAT repeat domain-containing protein [Pirellulales bacterium]|nr:HEAT repeat domain-containing protein [Pirellulales bacterium]